MILYCQACEEMIANGDEDDAEHRKLALKTIKTHSEQGCPFCGDKNEPLIEPVEASASIFNELKQSTAAA